MRRLRRAAGGALAAVALASALSVPAAAVVESAGPGAVAAAPVPPATKPHIVVLGVPGLRWSDVRDSIPTPGLWLMARDAALAALSVRAVSPTSCPLDGWLTLNSGARSIGPRPGGRCAEIPEPEGTGTNATFPAWSSLVAPNTAHSYDPVWGTLAGARPGQQSDPDSARCAVGPGAAVALTDATGRVRASYAPSVESLPPDACTDLLVIDTGPIPLGPRRTDALRTVDSQLEDLRARYDGSALVVAGLADSDIDAAHLSVLMVQSGDQALRGLRRGWLRAESTRRTGLVTITDLTPTLLGGETKPADLVGHALQSRTRIESTPAAVHDLARRDVAAQVIRDVFVPFFVVLIGGQLLLYLAAGLALRRRRIDRAACARALILVGLTGGAVPAASVLANLVPWQAAGHPTAALCGLVAAGAAAIAALAAGGPWRRRSYGPPTMVALVTALAFGLDVVLGSRLELNGLFGLSPLVAGRFYGFGNIAFSVFAMCALITAGGAGSYLIRRGEAAAAGGVVLALGGLAAVIDGWPDFGADFGGMLALVPGVAVLAAALSRTRLTPWRVLAVGGAAVGVAVGIAVLDWRRGATRRTHLGQFVQDVIDGHGPRVIGRKLDANFGLMVDHPIIVVAAVPLLALAVLVLFRPAALKLHGLARAQDEDPVLRPLLLACLCTALVGFAVNDSGVIVPAVALVTSGPLFVALWAGIWMNERT